jgi:hypothetical protein
MHAKDASVCAFMYKSYQGGNIRKELLLKPFNGYIFLFSFSKEIPTADHYCC